MSASIRAVLAAQRIPTVAAADAPALLLTPRWKSPGTRVRMWLHRLGRKTQAEARAEEGRDSKYPTEGR